MIKFKIRNEEQKPTEKTHEIEVWLESARDMGHSGVVLRGRDISGKTKNIVEITKDGRLHRYTTAQLNGLQTNLDGKIIEDWEA